MVPGCARIGAISGGDGGPGAGFLAAGSCRHTGSAAGGAFASVVAAANRHTHIWAGDDRHDCRGHAALADRLGCMDDQKDAGGWTKLN